MRCVAVLAALYNPVVQRSGFECTLTLAQPRVIPWHANKILFSTTKHTQRWQCNYGFVCTRSTTWPAHVVLQLNGWQHQCSFMLGDPTVDIVVSSKWRPRTSAVLESPTSD